MYDEIKLRRNTHCKEVLFANNILSKTCQVSYYKTDVNKTISMFTVLYRTGGQRSEMADHLAGKKWKYSEAIGCQNVLLRLEGERLQNKSKRKCSLST